MMHVQVDIPPGTHIDAAAVLLVGEANLRGAPATASFNGIVLMAAPGSSASDVVAGFTSATRESAARYRRSPAGRAAARASREQVAELQSRADELAAKVCALDLTNQGAVLNFLGDLQRCSDLVGVKVNGRKILNDFAERGGLVPNMDAGEDYKAHDRHSGFRWLVGQALDGLGEGRSIHPMFHHFADIWREQWGAQ